MTNHKPPTGWASIVLVMMMLLTVAWSIAAANPPTPGIGILTPVVIGGVLAGAILGVQRWLPASLAHGWSMATGLFATIWLAAVALEDFPSAPVEQLAGLTVFERMQVVGDWYWAWIELMRTKVDYETVILPALAFGPLERNDLAFLFFIVTMGLLMWLLSYICTWFIVRYLSWWGAVLPAGFALVFNLTNARDHEPYVVYLAFFLFCALLLAAQTHLALQTERWRRERIGYSPDIGFDLLRDSLIVAVAAIGLAWLLPPRINSEALQTLARRMTATTQRDIAARVNRWFPTLAYPTRGGGNAFGTEMGLQGSISLGTSAIFDVTIEGDAAAPRYFRQAVFDTYDSSGWHRTAEGSADLPAGAAMDGGASVGLATDYAMTVPVSQTIRTFQPETRQLYAAPQPDLFDLPVRAEVAAGAADILAVESRDPLPQSTVYRALSRQSVADLQSLRGAATADPAWVAGRYLQVPDSLPERVRTKARNVTVAAANRYDAAAAIEAYLRTIPYSEHIDTPPQGRDRVDWFLFDERRGYCDYYSSAFVMLARSAGIPARVAAGYAIGDPPAGAEGRTFRQFAYDAHTWPEVYFPEYGWIEFEPTASLEHPPIARPATAAESEIAAGGAGAAGQDEDLLPEEERFDRQPPAPAAPGGAAAAAAAAGIDIPVWPILGALFGLAAIAGVGWLAWERPLRGLSPAAGVFARLVRVASWLGLRPRAADTPHEYGRRVAGAIPDGGGEVSTIVDAYVRERFGRRATGADEATGLADAWRHLRDRLVRAAGRLGWRRLRRG